MDDRERTSGSLSYLRVLEAIHSELRPNFYLEIGVRFGDSLALAECAAVGVDPAPRINLELGQGVSIVETTSDDFFSRPELRETLPIIDLAFIDGMHHAEFALRDFMNIERRAGPASVIVFDDVFPNHPFQATRVRKTGIWTGDVWKMVPLLRQYRPDVRLILLDSFPTGLLMVLGLDNQSTALQQNYKILEKEIQQDVELVPDEFIRRSDSLTPSDGKVVKILRALRWCRKQDLDKTAISERIDQILG